MYINLYEGYVGPSGSLVLHTTSCTDFELDVSLHKKANSAFRLQLIHVQRVNQFSSYSVYKRDLS